MSVVVRALVAVLLLAGLSTAPPASAAPDDWRLLYADSALRDGTGALKSEIPANISIDFPAARFSPDGTRLAVPGQACDEVCGTGDGAIRLHRPDGTSFLRGQIPNFSATSVAWSPDGSTVAVLGQWLTPGDDDMRIYLVPVDGSSPSLVYSDTQLLRISGYGGLSWNSDDDDLAFIATEFYQEEGTGPYFALIGGSDQVWTVASSATSVPARFTGRPSCPCDDFPGYTHPEWSPDGSRLAVTSSSRDEFGQPLPGFVGTLAPGALAAEPLNATPGLDQLAWSADGEYLAYGIDDTDDDFYADSQIVDADSGAVVETVEGVIAPFTDWLPCPGGTCQVWQDVYTPPVPFLNLQGKARAGKVIAKGEMGRVEEVETVRVTLQKRARAGSPWRKVASVDVEAVEGLFTKSFARPRAVQCRVRAVLTRDPRASDTDVFSC